MASGLYQYSLLDVIDIADITEREPAEVADTYFALMDYLGHRRPADRGVQGCPRRPLACAGPAGGARRYLRVAAGVVFRRAGGRGDPMRPAEQKIAEWEQINGSWVHQARRTLTEISPR